MIVQKIKPIPFAMAYAEISSIGAAIFTLLIGITSLNIYTTLYAGCLLLLLAVVQGLITGLLFAVMYNLISKHHTSMRIKVE